MDRCSIEVFVDDGEVVLTELIFPAPSSDGAYVYASDGSVCVHGLNIWTLRTGDALEH
jgi:sucrose-6-phosphate hydrolase SacC (GH32 family)